MTRHFSRRFLAVCHLCVACSAIQIVSVASAHPMLQNALDVVISPTEIVIDARISPEELYLIEPAIAAGPPAEARTKWLQQHAVYVAKHLHVDVENRTIAAMSSEFIPAGPTPGQEASALGLLNYRLRYPLPHPPAIVHIEQNFLCEMPTWSASCVLRIRQIDQSTFDTTLLTAEKTAEFSCDWPAATFPGAATTKPSIASSDAHSETMVGKTIRQYTLHGIHHILTGYDHLLFIGALVFAAQSLWDLIKVVSAFTLAHTLTLTLSVFNLVTLSERVVEPMIAASIVFVAVQNIFWVERSRGWSRLAIAFAFGLFHGLGFAGGLKEAMSGLPPITLWAALGAFSLGVELGHQIVMVPLFAFLKMARGLRGSSLGVSLNRVRQLGSAGICVAGAYFLVVAFR